MASPAEAFAGLYRPSEWQQEFHAAQVDALLGAGSAGPGKTQALIADVIPRVLIEHARCAGDPALAGVMPDSPLWDLMQKNRNAWGNSGGHGVYLRRIYQSTTQVKERMERIYTAIDPGCRWIASDKQFVFSSGYRQAIGHCQHDEALVAFMSNEYDWQGFDELIEFEKNQFETIRSRRRTSDPILRHFRRVVCSTNPVFRRSKDVKLQVSNPHWVRDYFVRPWPKGRKVLRRTETNKFGKKVSRTRMFLPATLYDNPDKQFVEQYEGELLMLPTAERKALLDGDWWVVAGAYFSEHWSSTNNIIEPFDPPKEWRYFRSGDWGYRTYGVVHWWALTPEEELICLAEFSFIRTTPRDVAKRIREVEEKLGFWGTNGSKLTGPMDKQLWEERGSSSKSKAEEMAEIGVNWVRAEQGFGSRQRLAELVDERLKGDGAGTKLMFFRTCVKAIETVPAIPADFPDMTVPQKGGDDHWYDSVSYACAYASHGFMSLSDVEDDDEDFVGVEDEDLGRYGRGVY